MKNIFASIFISLFILPVYAVDTDLGVRFGNTTIDGENFTTLHLSPDLKYKKFSLAIDFELLFNNDGFEFRDDAYDSGAGFLSGLRYFNYGTASDNVYVHIGEIRDTTLGRGFLVYKYDNVNDQDNRKIGAEAHFDLGYVDLTLLGSDIGNSELIAGNIAFSPFEQLDIPIINSLEGGFTYVSDNDVNPNSIGVNTDNNLSMIGFNLGLTVVKSSAFDLGLHYDYGSIDDFGSGQAIGATAVIRFPSILEAHLSYERRLIGDEFIPALVDPFYDRIKGESSIQDTLAVTRGFDGNFFEANVEVFKIFTIESSWQQVDVADQASLTEDQLREQGLFYSELSLAKDTLPIDIGAKYIQTGVASLSDIDGADENSLAEIYISYPLKSGLQLKLAYEYTWVENELGEFDQQRRFIPLIEYNYSF